MNAKKTEELCHDRRPSGSSETFGAGGRCLHRVENSGGTPLTWPAANGRLVSREVLGTGGWRQGPRRRLLDVECRRRWKSDTSGCVIIDGSVAWKVLEG